MPCFRFQMICRYPFFFFRKVVQYSQKKVTFASLRLKRKAIKRQYVRRCAVKNAGKGCPVSRICGLPMMLWGYLRAAGGPEFLTAWRGDDEDFPTAVAGWFPDLYTNVIKLQKEKTQCLIGELKCSIARVGTEK